MVDNLNDNINSIILSITDNCNLKCKYCFVQHNTHNMPLEVSKQAVDYLAISKSNEKKEITFFGGEPLLLYNEIIVPTIEYAEQKINNVFFSITTNGILLDENKLKYLQKHNVQILLSMDGEKYTQDFNRPLKNGGSSFNILQNKLSLILRYYPNLSIRGTLYPPTCKNLSADINFFISKGIKDITFYPDEFSDWTEEDLEILQREIRKISIYYLTAFSAQNKPINFSPFLNKFKDLYNKNNNNINCTCQAYCDMQCGLGHSNVTIDYQGNIFACQELSSYPLNNNPYLIGDIYKGIDINKYNNLQNLYKESILELKCENQEKCLQDKCDYFNLCKNGYCHANSFIKFHSLKEKSNIKCFWDNLLYNECKMIFLILMSNDNESFNNYYLEILKDNGKEDNDE